MPEVLVHPRVVTHPTQQYFRHYFMNPRKGQLPSFLLVCFVLLCFICSSTGCAAQTLINGQSYTNGLAIINAPYPGSQQHAGSTMPISIELSGNGKLPSSAFAPGSRLASSYELLEIYLVSSQTKLNLTISSGTGLLTGETGTVRHHDTALPSCVPTGEYNASISSSRPLTRTDQWLQLTFYESSYINSVPHFTITPIPISILNNAASVSSCTGGINQLQAQPQPDSDFGKSPFNPNLQVAVSTGSFVSGTTPTSPIATGPTTFIGGPTPTLPPEHPSELSGSVTLVIVSQVVTTTTNSLNQPMTTSYMTTRTTIMPMSTAANVGVIPINAGTARLDHLTCIFVPLLIIICAIALTLQLD